MVQNTSSFKSTVGDKVKGKIKENGHRSCPRCGELVEANVLKEGYELKSFGAAGYEIPYSMVEFKEIKYNCPKDGEFTQKNHGKTDYFTGC